MLVQRWLLKVGQSFIFENQLLSLYYYIRSSMRKQFIEWVILLLASYKVIMMQVNNVLAIDVTYFDNISEAYLTLAAERILLVRKNQNTGQGMVVQYVVNNGSLLNISALPTQNNFSNYWQLYSLETQLMSFPIKINEQIDIYTNLGVAIATVRPNSIIFRGLWMRSQGIAFFSTVVGEVGYSNLEQIKRGQITFMQNSHHVGNTFLSLSSNQLYLCSTDIVTGLVSIWDVQNKRLLKQIWLNESGILTHAWSADSIFLFVFGCQSGIIYKLEVQQDFQIVDNFSTNISYIFSSFYYYETEELIAIASNRSQILVVDLKQQKLSSISVTFAPTKLRLDFSRRYFTVFNQNNFSLFKIKSFCNDSSYYDRVQQICLTCGLGCQTCDGYTCYSCQAGYFFNQAHTACTQKASQNSSISQVIHEITEKTFLVVNSTINVAGHRQFLNTFFQLFSNFDHFLLYIYHERAYGPNMDMILKQIHDTIDIRFQIISEDLCKTYLGIDFDTLQPSIDFKENYSFQKYMDLQQNGQGFFQSNLQYFLLNLPVMLLTLLAYRIVYRIFRNFRLSTLIKRFTWWGVIILLLLEGNIEFFFFSFTGDFLTFFSFRFGHKMFNVITVTASFIFLTLSTYGFISLYLAYGKRSSQFFDNCRGKYSAAFYYLVINGVFNMARGVIHRIAISQPQAQAYLLLLLEFSQSLLMLFWWKKIKIFQSSFVFSLFISGSISRSFFALSLALSSQIQLQNLDNFHVFIFLVNVFTFLLSIVQNIYQLFAKIKFILTNPIKKRSQNYTGRNQLIRKEFSIKKSHQDANQMIGIRKFRSKRFNDFKFQRKTEKTCEKTIRFKICRKKAGTILNYRPSPKKKQEKLQVKFQLQSINLE